MDLVSKAVEEQLPKPSSQLSKLVRSLGLNLLLASYDAITPYRAMTSPTLLYDTVFRLQEGAWTLDHDVMDFVANGNHMTITRYREYGGFKYYEIALANPEDDFHIRPGSARAESTIVIRVPDNANQVRVKGIYAYIECNDVVNGIPVGAIGPTLTMDQVNEHIKNGDLNDWLANRQSAVIGGVNVGSALIPHLMMFPWISIVQGQAPWSLTGLANDVDKFLDSK